MMRAVAILVLAVVLCSGQDDVSESSQSTYRPPKRFSIAKTEHPEIKIEVNETELHPTKEVPFITLGQPSTTTKINKLLTTTTATQPLGPPPTPPPTPPTPPLREDDEAEHLELGMTEILDDKRFQESEKKRVSLLGEEMANNDAAVHDEGTFLGLCTYMRCSVGRLCETDERGDAMCNCIKECPENDTGAQSTCSNHNETWDSDCLLYQQRCLCLEGSELCRDVRYQHVQVNYYGACREMPPCTEEEMEAFPETMREWLFTTMREVAEWPLTQPAQNMRKNLTQRWVNAVIWKWCDFQSTDDNRFVSVHELFPFHTPLQTMEQCIAPFVKRCDEDSDHRITLSELTKCLQLDENEMEHRCDRFLGDPSAADY